LLQSFQNSVFRQNLREHVRLLILAIVNHVNGHAYAIELVQPFRDQWITIGPISFQQKDILPLELILHRLGVEHGEFVLRLSPLFPFNLLNYALGLTTVRFADFLVASVGMLPGTLLYVYSGKVAGEVALAAGGAGPPRGPGYYGVLGLGLAATIGVTILITRTARRALREAVE
jgi:hypothetical protein